jgi:hypothetical protein
MKFILIVFAAYQYDGGIASNAVEFSTMALCEQARTKLIQEHHEARPDGWGRVRITAICAARG